MDSVINKGMFELKKFMKNKQDSMTKPRTHIDSHHPGVPMNPPASRGYPESPMKPFHRSNSTTSSNGYPDACSQASAYPTASQMYPSAPCFPSNPQSPIYPSNPQFPGYPPESPSIYPTTSVPSSPLYPQGTSANFPFIPPTSNSGGMYPPQGFPSSECPYPKENSFSIPYPPQDTQGWNVNPTQRGGSGTFSPY